MNDLHSGTIYGDVGISFYSVKCPNKECKQVTLEVRFFQVTNDGPRKIRRALHVWQLMPESGAKPQPDYIPAPIREDYLEACLIQSKSPKASATLARRCLQGMIRDFWEIKKGRLVDEIDTLQDRVDADVWEAINAVRKVGNVGAHMEKDIDLIVPVDPGEAGLLISLIEQLFEEWYVRREERRNRMALITSLAKEKDELKKRPNDKGLLE
ncbi:MAG: DUF4145 domain-containing protein [Rhodobacteraceae bacterium]|nr:DUF4145 domain-containing protein [Paracoccaceae bacterium]